MRSPRLNCVLASLLAITILGLSPANAAMVQKMNLQSLCDSAGAIARVEVAAVEEATVPVPGGELPVRIYTLHVREALKGVSAADRAQGTFTLTMLDAARLPRTKSGTMQHIAVLPDLPVLEPGGEYLLMTTAPSAGGLATTVGLGQGLFHVLPGPHGVEQVRNGLDNIGLLDGMATPKSITSDALTYGQITHLIRNAVGASH